MPSPGIEIIFIDAGCSEAIIVLCKRRMLKEDQVFDSLWTREKSDQKPFLTIKVHETFVTAINYSLFAISQVCLQMKFILIKAWMMLFSVVCALCCLKCVQ